MKNSFHHAKRSTDKTNNRVTQRASAGANGAAIARHQTGLPDGLKQGAESLSGFSLDDVRVHTNSPQPAKLDAHAYAQGSDIHLAPGQERYLPHEAWHVVQQKQGRVKATMQANGTPVNDDKGLEREADAMGSKSIQQTRGGLQNHQARTASAPSTHAGVAQLGKIDKKNVKKRYLLTRIIRQDQMGRRNIGTNSVRTSSRSLGRNLKALKARGKGKTVGSRIYSYMRTYGGAGLQGFHRESRDVARSSVVRGILTKMNGDPKRTTTSSRGKKFVMVVTHQDLVGSQRVYDLQRSAIKNQVLTGKRAGYGKMYKKHKTEGVVAVDGDVSVDQVLALRAFRGVPSEEELDEIIEGLLDAAEARLKELLENETDDEPGMDEDKRDDKDDDEDNNGSSGGGGMGLGQLRDDLMVST